MGKSDFSPSSPSPAKPPPGSALVSALQKIRAWFVSKEPVTEDDVRTVLLEGEKSGAVDTEERKMAEGVFYLGDRPVRAFMTHRSEIEWLDADCTAEEARETAVKHRAQRYFPVARGTLDEIAGLVSVEDILLALLEGHFSRIEDITKKARFIPETMTALKAFEAFKSGEGDPDYLCVMDEYGGFAGSLTLRDLMEAIAGGLAAQEGECLRAAGTEWIADGNCNFDEFAEKIGLTVPDGEHSEYHTLAGYILSMAEEIPSAGDKFSSGGWTFIITDMDGNRINKVRICKDSGV